jgi:arylsulfatase A-like enzyme
MPTTGGLRLASFGRRHATTFSVTALVALMAAGCSPQQPTQVPAYELGDNLRFAHISRETAAIDVGSADDESHLLFGWSHREGEARSGRTFRWGLEPHSELSFTVVEPRTVTLRLEGRPHKGRSRRATVTVELNEEPVGRLELRPGPQSYALPLAEELLRRGVNRLRLRYGPVGAVLRSVRRRFVGGDGTLAVHLQSDDVLEQRLASLTGEGELEITLPVGPSEPIRLSLAAIPAGPGGEGAGVALDLPTIWSDAPTEIVRPAPRVAREIVDRPNVIIYLVDTLRADHLGCYGHQRGVSPRIDRFAEGATLFENTRAQAPWTLPSVASVMTGLWPPSHGVFEDTRRLAPEAVTLAEVLRDAGYQTAAVVTNGFATGAYGLDQGFDELTLIKTGHRKSHLVHRAAVAWLEDRDPERPFFLYLHTIDPHKPYLPTQELRQRFAPEAEEIWREIVANPRRQRWPPTDPVVAQLRALYDAEIAENDASFGDTLDALASAGLYDDALIVFLSDHGEEFHEHHSWTHAADLFREVLNVPLIVKLPRQRHGHRVSALAQQIDLMPTLLTYLGIPGPPTQGRLLPTLLGPDEPTPVDSQRVFSHTKRKNQTTASIIDSAWKYIRRVDSKGVTSRLYNWHDDPHELNDRTADYPVLANLLAVEIQRQLAASTPPGAAEATPDEEVLDNLRALGYVD